MDNKICDLVLPEEKKNLYCDKLVDELPALRMKMGVSQDELAGILGLSRQTYSTIETKKRKMTWSVYLSLILIFDCCPQTHDIIHNTDIFPEFLLKEQSHDQRNKTNQLMHEFGLDEIRDHLDEQALHAIETIIMIEFARCNNMSGNSVIKAFDGKQFHYISEKDIVVQNALNKLKNSKEE